MIKSKIQENDTIDFDYDSLDWVNTIYKKHKKFKISSYATELAFFINLCYKYEPVDKRDNIDVMFADITSDFNFNDKDIKKIKKIAKQILKYEYGIKLDKKGRLNK